MARGPSYPYVGLEEAISFARKVYDYAKRGPAVVDSLITDALKYSATSSSGIKTLAALRAFGLIEDAGGISGKAVKITQRTIRILFDDPESSERNNEIKKAALSPKWYEYCWKKWGVDMPPAMKHNLIVEHGFVESTVESFLKDYRATIAYAGLLDDKLFGRNDESDEESKNSFPKYIPKIGDWVQWEVRDTLQMPAARKLTHFSPKGDFAFVEDSLAGIPLGELIAADAPEIESSIKPLNNFVPAGRKPNLQGGVNMRTETFSLPDGISISVQWPSSVSPDAVEDFEDYLKSLVKRVKRASLEFGKVVTDDKTNQQELERSS